MRAGRLRTCGGSSRLHGDDRLRSRDSSRHPRKFARVAEGLEVEQDHVGARIVFPVLEQVVRRDVRFVADGYEGRQPEALLSRPLEQGKPERATLRRETDLAGWKGARSERRVQ